MDSTGPRPFSVQSSYTSTPEGEALSAEVSITRSPRGPEMLLDLAAGHAAGPIESILDVGCGKGRWSIALAQRFTARVLAVDLTQERVAATAHAVRGAGLEGRVAACRGSIHHLPMTTASVDLVWCRDMLNHVSPLEPAITECARVLRPGGAMIVFQTFAGDLLEPLEAARLCSALVIDPDNMSVDHAENVFLSAGFAIARKDVIRSEWREHEIEAGDTDQILRDLLTVARLERERDDLVDRYGAALYELLRAGAIWRPYQMLGKLLPIAYLLVAPAIDP
ncbi:MAG TPA: class I SAM-dependent methyltransferase [Candidatus Dormibacteraeota bacterium]|nr:class I SAM-dependent methyltransferase [Candidatus Dormibacteraeota bacterium]